MDRFPIIDAKRYIGARVAVIAALAAGALAACSAPAENDPAVQQFIDQGACGSTEANLNPNIIAGSADGCSSAPTGPVGTADNVPAGG